MNPEILQADILNQRTESFIENSIILVISIQNKGTVKFGPFNTENGQLKKKFPKGKNIRLEATPEKDHKFSHWLQRIKKDGGFSFISSKSIMTLVGPDKSREVQAVFEALESD